MIQEKMKNIMTLSCPIQIDHSKLDETDPFISRSIFPFSNN